VPNISQNGPAIRTIRVLLRKMSRDDLAKQLGISYPYLTNIENEYKNAPEYLLQGIAAALEVDVAVFQRERPAEDAEKAA